MSAERKVLKPIAEPKKRRAKFHSYDLEWIPGKMDLRLVGVKDATGYRSYSGGDNIQIVQKFLDAELTLSQRGDWFYAHAGGLADMQFVLDAVLEDPEYRVEAAFSGSAAVIVRVRRQNASWIFIDSLFTLKASLAKIGELIGKPKGDVAWDAPIAELRTYNEQDCTILYDAISKFEDTLVGLGSELRMTLASCAMRLFRRRYLRNEVPTHQGLNQKLRPAYVGGRVEVFYRKPIDAWLEGKTTPGYYYDVNSCYPWAMTKPLPERLERSMGSRLPEPARDGTVCYFADVTIDVPHDRNIPSLPYIWDGSLYFPTGERRSWLCGPEIERALETGATIREVHECLVYRAFDDLARFADDVYRLRMGSRGFLNYNYKILNNSCYGKFCERSEKCALLVNPTRKELERAKELHRRGMVRAPKAYDRGKLGTLLDRATGHLHLLTPGAWLLEKSVPVYNAHVPIGAYVTSHARALLHAHLCSSGFDPLYCDTDGFMLPLEAAGVDCAHDSEYCKGPCPAGPRCSGKGCPPCKFEGCDRPGCRCAACGGKGCAGCALGGLKRERILEDSMFYAPKLYYLAEENGFQAVKAKGFGGICDCLLPLGYARVAGEDGDYEYVDGGADYHCPTCGKGRKDKLGRVAFEKLIGGKAAVANRMLRLKQLYGHGETRPREAPDLRHVAGSKPKRCFSVSGTSRPWSVEELHAGVNVPEEE